MTFCSASHSRAADCTSVSSTGWSSKVERLMTFSTSAVAVCCSSDSERFIGALAQLVEQACVLDRDNGLAGEILDQLDLLLAEWTHLLTIDTDRADQFILVK